MDKKIYRMSLEERQEYFYMLLVNEIDDIKNQINVGKSKREILLMNEYSKEALEKSGVGISDVVPRREPQTLYDDLSYCIPNEGKFEYANGILFINKYERDSLLLYLLGNAGLERVINLLPEESKEILRDLLKMR